MAALRKKISVKNLCPYHPPSKKLSRAGKGCLKMPELRKKFPENLRSFPLENCFACRQRSAKKIEWRNFFMKNHSSYHPRSKFFSHADKGGLKMAELRKNFCEKLLSLSSPFKKFSRAGKGCLKNG